MTIAGLSSCLSEAFDLGDGSKDKGNLELNVDIATPQNRAQTYVSDYPVVIYDGEKKVVASYNTVSAVPSTLTLTTGNYSAESHTPGNIQSVMNAPYYKGFKEFEILKDVNTQVDVICKMQNSQINIKYTEEFTKLFTSWTITFDDGTSNAISFSENSTANSVYWYLGENGVKELNLNFRGETTTGNVIASRNVLTKDDASSSYDDDRENFGGGDILNFTFNPTDATDGVVNSVTITADVTFSETNESVNINVIDVPGYQEEEEPTPGPGGDDNGITLTLPNAVSMTAAEASVADPSTGDVRIQCENGVKSILVKVTSTSASMIEQLTEVGNQYEGVDLVNGCEVVANQNLVSFLEGLDKTITVPAAGDKDYTFPVGQFYGFLGILPGTHNFTLTVIDAEDNQKVGTVQVTIK